MPDLVTLGEKGQIVIPKRVREDFRLKKGTKLLLKEEEERIILKPITLDEPHYWMLVAESSLRKTWDNKYDERWDDVL